MGGVPVRRETFDDIRINVGNRDQNPNLLIKRSLTELQLIQILRIHIIDGRPEKMPQGAKQLNVAIEQDGSVFVEDKWVPADQLNATFVKIHDLTPDKEVVIKADRRIRYTEVRKLLKALNQAGFPGAGLETHRKNQGA